MCNVEYVTRVRVLVLLCYYTTAGHTLTPYEYHCIIINSYIIHCNYVTLYIYIYMYACMLYSIILYPLRRFHPLPPSTQSSLTKTFLGLLHTL